MNYDIDILVLQKMLNKLKIRDINGNSVIEDGKFGANTKAGVKRLQGVLGIETDGIPTLDIWNYISHLIQMPLLMEGSTDNIAIRYLQWRLGVAIDGAFGSVTKAAIARFQRVNNLNEDGIVGKNTWKKLFE